jgi:hypothetical protein
VTADAVPPAPEARAGPEQAVIDIANPVAAAIFHPRITGHPES